IKLEEIRASKDRMGRTASVQRFRVRKAWIYIPAAAALTLAIMTSVVGSVLAEAGASRTERRAKEALTRICQAENEYSRKSTGSFATLEKLSQANLVSLPVISGYDLCVEFAKDGHTFWARAVPAQEGLRGMIVDSRGVIVYDGGSE